MYIFQSEQYLDFISSDINLSEWDKLLNQELQGESYYRSKQFIDYLYSTRTNNDDGKIISIRDSLDNSLQGILFYRFTKERFSIYHKIDKLFPPLDVASVLGSAPLTRHGLPSITPLLDYILRTCPGIDGVVFHSIALESAIANTLLKKDVGNDKLTYIKDDWKDCHLIELPLSFELYTNRYSAKKRYNLKRQLKILSDHCQNTLLLKKIDSVEHVEPFKLALTQLTANGQNVAVLATEKYVALAKSSLLRSYILYANAQAIAIVHGTAFGDTLHIQFILYDQNVSRLSPGTMILYLVVKELIENSSICNIDLGYSNPAHVDQATNTVIKKGHVLVLRKTLLNFTIVNLHRYLSIFRYKFKNFLMRYSNKKLKK